MIEPIKEYPFALRPMIAAHRGDTSLDAAENSLDAIAGAMISGAEMIEVDVQWTLDEVFVCHHDEAFMLDDGKHMMVHRHTLAELNEALSLSGNSKGITKLTDVLQLTEGKIYLNLEIKEYSDRSPRKFMDALEKLLVEFKMEERVLFSSFRLEFIHEASWHIPSVIIQPTNEMYFYFAARTPEPILLPKAIEDILPSELLKISHATSYACQLVELTDARLADVRKHNILLSIYTVSDEEAFDQALALGAQALVCEDPSRFAVLRNERYPERESLMSEEAAPKKANRLLQERSPYLQQHAYNPVDWYPWSSEAFERAKAESKPIFLSIGYATCHWCHVMERESFENEAVAEFLNAHFVSIKVDREEMPDVDHIYMSAVQAFSGSGGWPMTLFLTADLKPFFAGTYFPPVSGYGRPGFLDLLKRVDELWHSEPTKLLESAEALTNAISSDTKAKESSTQLAWSEIAERGIQYFRHVYDAELGGFGPAPKFPRPVQFDFQFDHAFRTKDEQAAEMAISTLRKMARGGMYDQLGGGFHRYSVDKFWLVPHFEKMLYDQAQLVNSYLDAYQITHDESFASIATGICDYVLRDLTHPDGGFYSAEDADSEGEEGTFYVWKHSEIVEALGVENASIVSARFGITTEGNFEHHTNVLHVARTIEEVAKQFGRTAIELESVLRESSHILLALRNKRERPLRDEKILTSWNGLMIGALARAGSVLGRADYVSAATKAAEFIWTELKSGGLLQHRWKDGEARFDAYLESYAFLIKGYLALYRATFEEEWLARAIQLQAEQDARLLDSTSGAYFMSAERSDLLFRATGDYDGAEPNGNSVTLGNMVTLYAMQGDDAIKTKAQALAEHFRAKLTEHPYAMPLLIASAQSVETSDLQIILAGEIAETIEMKDEIEKHFVGNAAIFRASKSAPIDPFYQWLDSDGPATANLCQNFVCQLPMDLAALREKLPTLAFQWRAE